VTIEARIAELLGDASLTALVGTRAGPVNAGESPALPYIVWQRVSADPVASHTEATTLEEIRVQFTCVASTYASACQIRRTLRTVLEAASGPITYEGATDIGRDDGLSGGIYAVSADFAFWHEDAA
jgi:hypothetical protein